MSARGSVKSTQSGLRNSFSILGTLDDHVDASAGKKKEKSVAAAPEGVAAKAVQVKKEESRPVPKANISGQQKKDQAEKQVKKVVDAPHKLVQKVQSSSATTQSNAGPLMKMLIFAVLMLILPIGAYYWSVNQAGLDLGEIKSALIAVLVVNILLFAYILMAFLEESKQNKIKKN